MARKHRKGPGNGKAFLYLRLSVDKEDGNAQSIEAQRNAATNYAHQNGIQIVGEYVESGISGTLKSRPEFNRMIAAAIGPERPVQYILIYRQARFARNATLFFQTTEALADAGVEMVSVTENFGTGRSKRMGQGVIALMDEQRALGFVDKA